MQEMWKNVLIFLNCKAVAKILPAMSGKAETLTWCMVSNNTSCVYMRIDDASKCGCPLGRIVTAALHPRNNSTCALSASARRRLSFRRSENFHEAFRFRNSD